MYYSVVELCDKYLCLHDFFCHFRKNNLFISVDCYSRDLSNICICQTNLDLDIFIYKNFNLKSRFILELLWTAPEILRNGKGKSRLENEVYVKGDIYSFGIICHEIVMRCAPFEGCDIEAEGKKPQLKTKYKSC